MDVTPGVFNYSLMLYELENNNTAYGIRSILSKAPYMYSGVPSTLVVLSV